MTPHSTRYDVADIASLYSNDGGNGVLCNALREKCSYLNDLFYGEDGPWMVLALWIGVAKHCVRVPNILNVGYPFQVLRSVVQLYSILVINFGSVRRWIEKRQGDKSMARQFSLFSSLVVQLKNGISSQILVRFHKAESRAPLRRIVSSNSSAIANRVIWTLRDCFPDLHRVTDFVRHLWPFSSRLRLFRCAQWRTPLGTPNYC